MFTTPATGVLDVTRTGATPSLGNNFALRKAVGTVSATVFIDANSDGVRQASDKPMAGVQVFLDANDDGVPNWNEFSGYTSATGQVLFSNVPVGSYRLGAALPGGHRFTTVTNELITVSLGSSTSRNIGVAPFAVVKGRAFIDKNLNGRMDAGEKALVNGRVFLDANRNGVFDSDETSVLTDSQGNYSFNSLAAGTYVIRLATGKGNKVSSPASGAHVVAVAAGQKFSGKNFVVVKG